jgi:hypothetical protein
MATKRKPGAARLVSSIRPHSKGGHTTALPAAKAIAKLPHRRVKDIRSVISKNRTDKADELSTDAQVLFGFLTLLVDIRYRNKYGKSFDTQYGKGYSRSYHKQLYSKSNLYKRKII